MKRIFFSLVKPRDDRFGRSALAERRGIHFLHIGKNAGSYIHNVSRQINALSSDAVVVKHSHDALLKDLPEDDPYFFSIRNPVSRFKSGFYSRKRKGQPRVYSEWSAHDEIAFSEFEHANDLAESLFENGAIGRKAYAAMKSIRHLSQNQCDWFSCCGNFLRVRPPIWIIRQENFDADIRTWISKAFPDLDTSKINFDVDEISSHRNNYSNVPELSDRAKENLSRWYIQDLQFYDMCSEWLDTSDLPQIATK